jgi:hypothetical protein
MLQDLFLSKSYNQRAETIDHPQADEQRHQRLFSALTSYQGSEADSYSGEKLILKCIEILNSGGAMQHKCSTRLVRSTKL